MNHLVGSSLLTLRDTQAEIARNWLESRRSLAGVLVERSMIRDWCRAALKGEEEAQRSLMKEVMEAGGSLRAAYPTKGVCVLT